MNSSTKNFNGSSLECRLCHGRNYRHIFDAGNVHGRHAYNSVERFPVYQCWDCATVFLGPVEKTPDYYARYYPESYHDGPAVSVVIRYLLERLGRASFRHREKTILALLNPPSASRVKILDVGCGPGHFLDFLNPERFEKYGLDVNASALKEASRKGINIFPGRLEEAKIKNGFFDVVCLWHVIEHASTPETTLRAAHRVLKPQGVLVLSTPNTESRGFRWGRRDWFHLDAPRHLTLFNKNNLTRLLKECGFEVLKTTEFRLDYPLDLFWSIRRRALRFPVYLFYGIIKFFAHETMLFVCRKDNHGHPAF